MATATAPAPARDASPAPATGRRPGSIARYVLLVLLALVIVGPLVFILMTSFKTQADATGTPPTWIPESFTGQAYDAILGSGETPVLRWFMNSMIAAVGNAALVVTTSALAAYPLARMEFRGKKIVFWAIISTLFIPPVILTIPNYLIVGELRWLDTLVAVIVPTAASAFGVFFLRQFFLTLPMELEEAALIDGATRWQVFRHVALPIARPGMAVAFILAVIFSWNNFVFGIVLAGRETRTLPVAVYNMISFDQLSWGPLAAAALIVTFPVLLLTVFAQRQIVAGLTAGAVKGG
jgi:multiple sugar transport system permease protein